MNQFVTPVTTQATLAPQVRKDIANIFFILDKSGSMGSLREQAISGFNSYIASQRQLSGITRLTFIQFNESRHVIYESQDVKTVSELDMRTYAPSGYTALNDSVGFVLSEHLTTCSPDETNIIAILTDGAENASTEYSLEQIKSLLAQAEAQGWEVLFLGANMSKATVVNTYGINASNVSAFAATQKGVSDAFSTLSASTTSYRGMKSAGNLTDKVDVEAVYVSASSGVQPADFLNGLKLNMKATATLTKVAPHDQ